MVKIFLSVVIVLWATVASANILGNMQTFSPNPDSLFFENVHASKTLRKNHFNLGYYMSYVRNQLSVYEPLGTQNFINYKDKSVTFDFVAAWGVTDNFEITYALPGFIQQEPDSGQYQNNYVSDGINTHRPGIKYDISQSSSGGLAVLASVDFPVTKNDPYTGTDVDPIYNLELAYDVRGKTSAYAFNLGYRFRSPGNLPANSPYFFPLQDQILLSAGYVTALNTNRRYHFELYGAMAADKDPHQELQHVSALEGLIAFKQKIHKGLWGHIGATGEILREGLAPQYRVYAGVNWFFGIEDKNEAASSSQPVPVEPAHVDVVQETASEITVDPSNIELFEGGEIDVAVSGGAEPLIYELSKPFGEFNSNAMTYFAPARPGEVQLIITDALNQRKTVNIKVIPVPKANKEVVIKGLFFKFNTDELTEKSKKILDENVAKLQGQKIQRMVVAGHTDNIGKDVYNLNLSRKRAKAVALSLSRDLDIPIKNIHAVGYGESRPVDSNKTDKGRQNNRRVELKLYY